MTIKFSPELNTVLAFSKEEAERLHNECVTPIHLVLAILRHKEEVLYIMKHSMLYLILY